MKPDASDIEKFNGWFTMAIDKLAELPEGDGAFAAMMIVLPLYERSIVGRLKLAGVDTTAEAVRVAIGNDLNLSDPQRRVFWEMFRNGFLHQGMVKAGRTQWVVSHVFGSLPEFRTLNGIQCVCVDPWKFARRVLGSFLDDPRLISASESFPLAGVFPMQSDAFVPEVR